MAEPKPRILLVDDELPMIMVTRKRLEAGGCEVEVAMDGEAGLVRAQEWSPDLILLDVMLPKMDGYAVCTRLKQDPKLKKIPVILFSALAQENDKKTGRECGADAYVVKPYEAAVLLSQIRSLVGEGK